MVDSRLRKSFEYRTDFADFFSAMQREVARDQSRDVYIDTNHLRFSLPYPYHNADLFSLYLGILKYNKDERYKRKFYELHQKLSGYASFVEELLSKDNVFITSGVVSELDRLRERAIDRIEGIDAKWNSFASKEDMTKPLDLICDAAMRNNERISGIEEDPLVERIYRLVPKVSLEGRKPLSETDKTLISLALANGLTDGRRKLIMTWDRLIKASATALHTLINEEPHLLDTSDLVSSFSDFERANLSIGNIFCSRFRDYHLIESPYFENFFFKKRD